MIFIDFGHKRLKQRNCKEKCGAGGAKCASGGAKCASCGAKRASGGAKSRGGGEKAVVEVKTINRRHCTPLFHLIARRWCAPTCLSCLIFVTRFILAIIA